MKRYPHCSIFVLRLKQIVTLIIVLALLTCTPCESQSPKEQSFSQDLRELFSYWSKSLPTSRLLETKSRISQALLENLDNLISPEFESSAKHDDDDGSSRTRALVLTSMKSLHRLKGDLCQISKLNNVQDFSSEITAKAEINSFLFQFLCSSEEPKMNQEGELLKLDISVNSRVHQTVDNSPNPPVEVIFCQNGGIPIGGGCLCPIDFVGIQCERPRTFVCRPTMLSPKRVSITNSTTEEKVEYLKMLSDLHYNINMDGDRPQLFFKSTEENIKFEFSLYCYFYEPAAGLPSDLTPVQQIQLDAILAKETPTKPRSFDYKIVIVSSSASQTFALSYIPNVTFELRPVNWNRPFSDERYLQREPVKFVHINGSKSLVFNLRFAEMLTDAGYKVGGRVYLEALLSPEPSVRDTCDQCVERIFIDLVDYVESTRIDNFWTAWRIGLISFGCICALILILVIAAYWLKSQEKKKQKRLVKLGRDKYSVPSKYD